MEQFAPYIGMTLVGLGIIGLAVGIGRIVIWYRRNPSNAGFRSISGNGNGATK